LRQESERRFTELNEYKLSAENRYAEAEAEIRVKENELKSALELNHNHWLLAESRGEELTKILEVNHNHWLLAESRGEELTKILHSRSWRFTKPLRISFFILHNPLEFLNLSMASADKYFDQLLKKITKVIHGYPRVKFQIEKFLFQLPSLRNQLDKRLKGRQEDSNFVSDSALKNLDMSELGVEIYYELKASLKCK